MEYKIGDWVEIVSNKNNNINEMGYSVGTVFKIAKCDEVSDVFKGERWLCPSDTNCWGALSSSVRPAKNKIVMDILTDL